jgi:hypothetical protein
MIDMRNQLGITFDSPAVRGKKMLKSGSLRQRMTTLGGGSESILAWYDEQLDSQLSQLKIVDNQLITVDPYDYIQKTDITTGTTGVRNIIYGREVFLWYSQQQNAWGLLPKTGWPENGWGYRYSSAAGLASGAGIAQGASVGTAVIPTYGTVDVTPKEVEVVTGSSIRLEAVHAEDDTITFEDNRAVIESNFFDAIDTDLLGDIDTTANANFESIDRYTESSTAASGVGFTAGDEDMYGVDRSSVTTMNSWPLHNSNVDRSLTISLINQMRQYAEEYWVSFPENKVFLTGYDTWRVWSELDASKQRYGQMNAVVTINGIETAPGNAGGYKVSTWEGVPVVRDSNCQVDTISRAYLLDFDYLGMAIGRPLEYIESDNPYEVGHNRRGLYYMIGEMYGVLPKTSAQLRDLQS